MQIWSRIRLFDLLLLQFRPNCSLATLQSTNRRRLRRVTSTHSCVLVFLWDCVGEKMTCSPQRRISHAVLLVSAPVILAKHTSRTQWESLGPQMSSNHLVEKLLRSPQYCPHTVPNNLMRTFSLNFLFEETVIQKCWELTACWRRRYTVNKRSQYFLFLFFFGRLHIFMSTAEEADWAILSKLAELWLINKNFIHSILFYSF